MLVLVCAQACLVPQSVDAIVVSAHPAPHFVLENFPSYLLASPVLQLYRQGSLDAQKNCHCEILIPQLFVEEDDPTVELQVRWFIDYDLSMPRSQAPWPGHTEMLAPNFDDATYTVRPVKEFSFDATAADIGQSGVHLLEVVVGETSGFDDSPSAAFPNRTMKPGFSLALYRFVINVNVAQDPARPSCASQPLPSIQVCQ